MSYYSAAGGPALRKYVDVSQPIWGIKSLSGLGAVPYQSIRGLGQPRLVPEQSIRGIGCIDGPTHAPDGTRLRGAGCAGFGVTDVAVQSIRGLGAALGGVDQLALTTGPMCGDVKRMQTALSILDIWPLGKADGVIGPSTLKAMQAFCKVYGLPLKNWPDAQFCQMLSTIVHKRVAALQTALAKLGYPVAVDGDFTETTEGYLELWLKHSGLLPTAPPGTPVPPPSLTPGQMVSACIAAASAWRAAPARTRTSATLTSLFRKPTVRMSGLGEMFGLGGDDDTYVPQGFDYRDDAWWKSVASMFAQQGVPEALIQAGQFCLFTDLGMAQRNAFAVVQVWASAGWFVLHKYLGAGCIDPTNTVVLRVDPKDIGKYQGQPGYRILAMPYNAKSTAGEWTKYGFGSGASAQPSTSHPGQTLPVIPFTLPSCSPGQSFDYMTMRCVDGQANAPPPTPPTESKDDSTGALLVVGAVVVAIAVLASRRPSPRYRLGEAALCPCLKAASSAGKAAALPTASSDRCSAASSRPPWVTPTA